MSEMGDGALLELFREEVRANAQILNEGLVALDRDPTDVERIEPLMRAAHSMKGAARVVGIDPAVTLAHAIEDCLVAAQESRITLDANDIDVLLKATDLLAGIAESAGANLPQWLAQSTAEIDELSTLLHRRSQAGPQTAPNEATATTAAPPERELSRSLAAAIAADCSRQFAASPLIELFRQETRKSVTAIRDALTKTDSEPTGSAGFESLVKAVQSVQSAARMINVQTAVELARMLQAAFSSMPKGGAPAPSPQREQASHLTELLERIASAIGPEYPQWLAENSSAWDEPPSISSSHAAAPDAAPGKGEPQSVAAEAGRQEPSTAPVSPAPPTSPAKPAPSPEKSADQVVRVTAQSLTRLMGLAGESLVEAKWLQPFSKSLLDLKRRLGRLADRLEEVRQATSDHTCHNSPASHWADVHQQVEACRQLLSWQIAEFEHRARHADDLNSRLYHEVVASRMRPFGDGLQGFPRMVRDLARQLDKQVVFSVHGDSTPVDRDILEKLEAPLNHILRNALDHGLESPAERHAAGKPESGRLEIEARHQAGMLAITIRDDGRGIDPERIREKVIQGHLADEGVARRLSDAELLEFLFLPAFSTAQGVTEVSGRGVGLDVVHNAVHSVGGSVRVQSELGSGTTFRLELPITLSVIRAVLVRIAGEAYAFPHSRIDRLARFTRADLQSLEHRHFCEVDGGNVGIVLASEILEMDSEPSDQEDLYAVLFRHHSDMYGLLVDEFFGESDLVVRPLDPRLGKVPHISAAAILDDGSPVLIVDLDDMRRTIERKLHGDTIARVGARGAPRDSAAPKRILVVDDSITVREVQRQLLMNHGYQVEVAVDGMEGWNRLTRGGFDLVITDIDMPRLNGFELVRMIRSDPQFRSLPVVIVSYKDRNEDRLRGMDAGANYYLTKSSFHDETLLVAVRELIGDADQ